MALTTLSHDPRRPSQGRWKAECAETSPPLYRGADDPAVRSGRQRPAGHATTGLLWGVVVVSGRATRNVLPLLTVSFFRVAPPRHVHSSPQWCTDRRQYSAKGDRFSVLGTYKNSRPLPDEQFCQNLADSSIQQCARTLLDGTFGTSLGFVAASKR